VSGLDDLQAQRDRATRKRVLPPKRAPRELPVELPAEEPAADPTADLVGVEVTETGAPSKPVLAVPGHQVGSSRLTGGRPPSAVWRR
jgi:hypothetical protein